MKKHKTYLRSARYRNFVKRRNVVLDAILQTALAKMDGEVADLEHIAKNLARSAVGRHGIPSSTLRSALLPSFNRASLACERIAVRLRTTGYGLALVSEAEAVARSHSRAPNMALMHGHMTEIGKLPTPSGGSVGARMDLYFMRLLHRVVDAVHMGILYDDKPEEMDLRVAKAFPRKALVRRHFHAFAETNRGRASIHRAFKDSVTTGFVDDETWDQIVQDYTDAMLPGMRGPKYTVKDTEITDELDGEPRVREKYAWEVEQETTQDFVERVRDGQEAGARANGVTDFMWIAILDKKTDECCELRDGHSSAEIEDMLQSGDLDADDSEATVPPAHFNCRCDLAPIGDVPPTQDDLGDFDTWLQ